MENAQAFETFSPAVRLGRRWFKWRSLSPLPLFLLLVIVPAQFTLGGLGLAAVLAGILVAEGLRIWAVGYAGSATRTRGDSVPALVHAGPYTHVRNPLYVAVVATIVGQALTLGRPVLIIYAAAAFAAMAAFAYGYEEPTLTRRFGRQYESYRRDVPAWVTRRRVRASRTIVCSSAGAPRRAGVATNPHRSYNAIAGAFVRFTESTTPCAPSRFAHATTASTNARPTPRRRACRC